MRLIDITVLLNIEASINQGKGFDATTQILQEFYGLELEKKEYAILSHCWSEHQQEVSFREMNKLGYKKIINTCTQAQKDRMEWVWVDTCCIDKKSSAEVYLHDVCDTIRDSWKNRKGSKATLRWFSRGWTLQELIAPKVVRFFNQKWEYIGNKGELAGTLTEITRIPVMVLWNGMQEALSSADNAGRPSVAQIISWAADRTTTREEDRAYSLLGLLGVHMPMMYGEGKNAFRRLQLKIIRRSNDHSIFAWGWTRKSGWSSSILADDPGCFRDCSRITILKPEEFTKDLREKGMSEEELGKCTEERLRTFTVTNDGILMWLPTATSGPFSEVTLACREECSVITIRLVIRGSTCFRIFGLPEYSGMMEFKQHFLPYKHEPKYSRTFTFELQDQILSHDGFVLDRVLPYSMAIRDRSIVLSKDKDFAAVTYVRKEDNTRFLVLLSYFGGHPSTFAMLAPTNFDQNSGASLRSRAFERQLNPKPVIWPPRMTHSMQHIHFRRSIEGVRVVYRVPSDSTVCCTVTIDITKCPGCCTHGERPTSELVETPCIPGLMWNSLRGTLPQTRQLYENYEGIPFSLIKLELKPGDYGRVSQDEFKPEGNIIGFARALGLQGIEDGICVTHAPALRSPELLRLRGPGQHSQSFDLYNGTGYSLQANQQLVSLLKELSCHLAGRLLVTTVVRCSDHYPLIQQHPSAVETLDTPTPLCSVMMPLIWRQIDVDKELERMFQRIVDQFRVLVEWLDRPRHWKKSMIVRTATNFFMDIFVVNNFRNFVGKMVFPSELPQILQMENHTKLSTEMNKGIEVTVMVPMQRIDPLVTFLKITEDGTFNLQLSSEYDLLVGSKSVGWTKLWENGSRRTPSFIAEVLKLISDVYILPSKCQDIKLDRQQFLFEVEEIKKLKELRSKTDDEDEKRTLLEDTVGKILLACWRGVEFEIVHVLRKVIDRYNNEVKRNFKNTTSHLCQIGRVFRNAIDYIPGDCPNPLQRILSDAKHGVSKYQLLLAARSKLASQSNEARSESERPVFLQSP